MTDRVRFEKKAIEGGATVLESTNTILRIQSANEEMITTNYFDEEGNLIYWQISYLH